MSNGYLLADANSLTYAYRAGGAELLDLHLDIAGEQARKFAITETILGELEKGAIGEELTQYFTERNIPIINTPETEQQLRTGEISRTIVGDSAAYSPPTVRLPISSFCRPSRHPATIS